MITNVTGSFSKFDATMESEATDFSDAKISFEADANSVNTGNEQRDGHLQGEEFFAAEKFPKLSFVSSAFTKKSGEEYTLTGNLTLRGVTKPVELAVEYGGTVTDPYGRVKSGFEITGKINRQDFGLIWGGKTEAGDVLIGDEVKLHINVQMIKS